MMKRTIVSLLSCFLFLSLSRPCLAQDISAEAYEKVVADNIELKKQLSDRELEIKALQDSLKKAYADLAKKAKEHQKAQDALDKAKQDNEQLKSTLRKDDYDKAMAKVQVLEGNLQDLKTQLDSLASENQNLNNVKLEIIKQREEAYQIMAQSPFSLLSAVSLRTALSECQVFKDDLKGTIDLLSRAQLGKELYDKATRTMTELSSRALVDQARTELKSRIDLNVDSPEQINELTELRKQLAIYKNGVDEYQAIIEVLNGDATLATFRESGNNRKALEQIEKDLKEDGMQQSFDIINQTPSLKDHFARFLQHMRENPIAVPAEQTEIQNL